MKSAKPSHKTVLADVAPKQFVSHPAPSLADEPPHTGELEVLEDSQDFSWEFYSNDLGFDGSMLRMDPSGQVDQENVSNHLPEAGGQDLLGAVRPMELQSTPSAMGNCFQQPPGQVSTTPTSSPSSQAEYSFQHTYGRSTPGGVGPRASAAPTPTPRHRNDLQIDTKSVESQARAFLERKPADSPPGSPTSKQMLNGAVLAGMAAKLSRGSPKQAPELDFNLFEGSPQSILPDLTAAGSDSLSFSPILQPGGQNGLPDVSSMPGANSAHTSPFAPTMLPMGGLGAGGYGYSSQIPSGTTSPAQNFQMVDYASFQPSPIMMQQIPGMGAETGTMGFAPSNGQPTLPTAVGFHRSTPPGSPFASTVPPLMMGQEQQQQPPQPTTQPPHMFIPRPVAAYPPTYMAPNPTTKDMLDGTGGLSFADIDKSLMEQVDENKLLKQTALYLTEIRGYVEQMCKYAHALGVNLDSLLAKYTAVVDGKVLLVPPMNISTLRRKIHGECTILARRAVVMSFENAQRETLAKQSTVIDLTGDASLSPLNTSHLTQFPLKSVPQPPVAPTPLSHHQPSNFLPPLNPRNNDDVPRSPVQIRPSAMQFPHYNHQHTPPTTYTSSTQASPTPMKPLGPLSRGKKHGEGDRKAGGGKRKAEEGGEETRPPKRQLKPRKQQNEINGMDTHAHSQPTAAKSNLRTPFIPRNLAPNSALQGQGNGQV